MQVDIPDWLVDMANEMRRQNNAATAHPIYVVKERIPFYLTESSEFSIPDSSFVKAVYTNREDTDDGLEFFDSEEELLQHYRDEMEYDQEDMDNIQIEEYCMYELQRPRAFFFTRKEAEELIERIPYKLADPFIYVESAYESDEVKQLMNWIISLGDAEMFSRTSHG